MICMRVSCRGAVAFLSFWDVTWAFIWCCWVQLRLELVRAHCRSDDNEIHGSHIMNNIHNIA